MDTETLNLRLPPEPFMKNDRGLRFVDENFVWIAVGLSVLAHVLTLVIVMRNTVATPPAVVEVKKPAARVRIFANPNGNPNSTAKVVEVAKPKPLPKPTPKPRPDTRVINTKPIEQPVEQPVVAEASGPQSFGDDVTGGVVGEGFSTTDGESDAGVTSNFEPIEKPPMQYPREAQLKGIEGFVLLRVDINEEGRVENIRVQDADPRNMFEKEARAMVRKYKYAPRMVNGVAAKTIDHEIRIDFKLEG